MSSSQTACQNIIKILLGRFTYLRCEIKPNIYIPARNRKPHQELLHMPCYCIIALDHFYKSSQCQISPLPSLSLYKFGICTSRLMLATTLTTRVRIPTVSWRSALKLKFTMKAPA